MTRIDKTSQMRIARAVNWVERQPSAGPVPTQPVSRGGRVAMPWWGIVKEVIDNKAAGGVYYQEGSAINPTTSGLSTFYNVANPWMGKLIIGMPVFVSQASIHSVTGGYVWYVTPFHQIYEGKVNAGSSIVAGGSGTVDLWEADAAISPAVTVTAYHRWIANVDLTPGTKVRLTWDIKLRRFVVDAWLCP